MLDEDVAKLYGISKGILNLTVKRNEARFPEEYVFKLTPDEYADVTGRKLRARTGLTKKVYAVFTWQGLAVLSAVINTEVAMRVNIHIVRVFVKMKELLAANPDIIPKLEEIEDYLAGRDEKVKDVFTCLKELVQEDK